MIDVEETTFDLFLRYGLFFGAVFQLVCIGAAIFGPDISESHLKEDNSEDSGSEQGSPINAHRPSSHSRRKMEKKKRRWTNPKLFQDTVFLFKFFSEKLLFLLIF